MSIYQALYAFQKATGVSLGDPGTHPWSQGFPLLTALSDGPSIPTEIPVTADDLRYPKAPGNEGLRRSIAAYYQATYGSNVTEANIMVFPGGRAALFAVLFLLNPSLSVVLEEVEYALYFDLLRALSKQSEVVPSNAENKFQSELSDYRRAASSCTDGAFVLRSNPLNPTGRVLRGDDLQEFLSVVRSEFRGAVIDEAYEFFTSPRPVSALAFVDSIDDSNLFVVGAATKGLQAPGARVGWVVASRENIQTLANYGSFVVGGVSQLSQRYVQMLLEPGRVEQAYRAVSRHYDQQRARYGEAFTNLGLSVESGEGGFYHWVRLPAGMTTERLNRELFKEKAAVLSGTHFDMFRRGERSELAHYFRFSFGPLAPESFESDVEILGSALRAALNS
jgi:aspartate/methionine/tyrosine aminotransferase